MSNERKRAPNAWNIFQQDCGISGEQAKPYWNAFKNGRLSREEAIRKCKEQHRLTASQEMPKGKSFAERVAQQQAQQAQQQAQQFQSLQRKISAINQANLEKRESLVDKIERLDQREQEREDDQEDILHQVVNEVRNLKQEIIRLKEDSDEAKIEELEKQVTNQKNVLKQLIQKVESNENKIKDKPTFAEAVKSARETVNDMAKGQLNVETNRANLMPSIMRSDKRISQEAPKPAPEIQRDTIGLFGDEPKKDLSNRDLYNDIDKNADPQLVNILNELTASAKKMFREPTSPKLDECDKQHPIVSLQDIESACTLDPTSYPGICDETSWFNPARWFGTQGYPREDVLRNLHIVKQRNKECKENLRLPPQYQPEPRPFLEPVQEPEPRPEPRPDPFLEPVQDDSQFPSTFETQDRQEEGFPARFTIKDTPDFEAPEGTREFKGGKKRKSKRRVRTRKRTRNRTPKRKRSKTKTKRR